MSGRLRRVLVFLLVIVAVSGGLEAWQRHDTDAIRSQARQSDLKSWASQVASCQRGNLLRRSLNERSRGAVVVQKVLGEFLRSARAARLAAAAVHDPATPADLKAAREYEAEREQLESVRYRHLPLVDCLRAIQKPKL